MHLLAPDQLHCSAERKKRGGAVVAADQAVAEQQLKGFDSKEMKSACNCALAGSGAHFSGMTSPQPLLHSSPVLFGHIHLLMQAGVCSCTARKRQLATCSLTPIEVL